MRTVQSIPSTSRPADQASADASKTYSILFIQSRTVNEEKRLAKRLSRMEARWDNQHPEPPILRLVPGKPAIKEKS